MRNAMRTIPFGRFAMVASAGLVAFMAFWQGFFSLIYYRPCPIQVPNYSIPPNPEAAITQFALSAIAIVVLFVGTRRLQNGFGDAAAGYKLVIANLLIGESLLTFMFVRLSTCAG